MAPLRQRYLANLSTTCDELTGLLHKVQEAVLSPLLIEKLTRLAHNMAGSGTSYGFPAISKIARVLETSLDGPVVDRADVVAKLQKLIGACEVLLDRPVKVSLAELTHIVQRAQPVLSTVLAITNIMELRQGFAPFLSDCADLICVHSATEAFGLLRTVLPDLILLDDNVPGLTTAPLLAELRANPVWQSIPVIVLTSKTNSETRAAMEALQVLDIINPPIAPAVVAQKVKAHLKRLHLKVLLVDDDQNIRDMLSAVFEAHGIRMLTANSGPDALALMKKERPNGILLDHRMPGMSGEDVLKAMKDDPTLSDIPVVFLTANHAAENVVRILKLGAIDYIIKPIDPEAVFNRCHKLANTLRKN